MYDAIIFITIEEKELIYMFNIMDCDVASRLLCQGFALWEHCFCLHYYFCFSLEWIGIILTFSDMFHCQHGTRS